MVIFDGLIKVAAQVITAPIVVPVKLMEEIEKALEEAKI